MSSVANARAKQAQAKADGGDVYARIEALLDKHKEEAWSKRALKDIQAFIKAAKRGVLPGFFVADCKKCSGTKGIGHHIMCKRNGKGRDYDKHILAPVVSILREIALAAKAVCRCVEPVLLICCCAVSGRLFFPAIT
jgi:hypothetical protein